MRYANIAVWTSMLACLACDSGQLSDPQYDAITRIDAEAPGENCAAGGQAVRTGLDRNRDGSLQDGEITGTEYLCAQAARTLLVRSAPEPVGANCAEGGSAVYAGLDDDGDGTLAEDEVDRTTYLCEEAEPDVLVRTARIAADATCPPGGSRVEAGRDRDGSGSLEDDEVEQDRVVCGPEVLVRTDEVSSADACRGSGATRVRSGPDTDGDGTLDDGEIAHTGYVCSAETNAFYVREQADLDYLAHVGVVRGDLIIESSTLVNVSISRIVVTGAMRVRDCPALEELVLWPDMAGGDVEVARTPALTWLSIRFDPSPSTGRYLPILGDLSVSDAPALDTVDLTGVPYIQGSLVLLRSGVVSLETKDTVEDVGLEWIGGDFRIEDNDRFVRAVVPRLTRIGGSFILRGNDAVESWDQSGWGRNRISSVGERSASGGDVIVEDNPRIGSLHLDRLTKVTGGVRVRNNAQLSYVLHRALVSVEDDYVLTDNPVLTHFGSSPIEDALSIGGWVQVERNPMLLDLVALVRLEHVGRGVIIRDNASLQWLTMNALQQLPVLVLERNESLHHLGASAEFPGGENLVGLVSCVSLTVRANVGLSTLHLPALTQVTSVTVQDNAALPTCQAEALAAQANASPSLTTISGNLDGGTCP